MSKVEAIKIKGKDYVQVAERAKAFHADNAQFIIDTEVVQLGADFALVKATVSNGNGRTATGHGYCNLSGASQAGGRFVEKAETSALGRALANLGYGTAALLEDEDEDYIADSPKSPKAQPAALPSQTRPRTLTPEETAILEAGFLAASGDENVVHELIERCKFKYNIVRLCDLPAAKFESVREYLEKLAGERIELEAAADDTEATPEPVKPAEKLSGDRVQRIKVELAKAYGEDKVQHHIRLIYQVYGVKTLPELTVDQYKEITLNAQQARVRRENGNGSTPSNGNQPTVDTKGALFKAFMADGNKAYGKQWNLERKRIVGVVTDGRTDSAAGLYDDELGAARKMLKAEFDEMVAGMVAAE